MTSELPQVIRIGTRKSKLALAQAEQVRLSLQHEWPELAAPGRLELVPMVSTGDRITDRPLAEVGGKGLFAKELDEALIYGQIDLAVHSTKDMESILHRSLNFISVLEREDNRDCFVSSSYADINGLPPGLRIGTSSVRRAAQLRMHHPALEIVPLRGNVITRLTKLDKGEMDGAILALAGMKRLGLASRITAICDREAYLPAAGQGAIGIVCRTGDTAMHTLLSPLNHAETYAAVTAERSLLATLDGSCQSAIAAWGRTENGRLKLSGALYARDGSEHYRIEREGNPDAAEAMGEDGGRELLARGSHLL